MAPHPASKSGKRKSAHFEKDSSKLSPNAKRSKNSDIGKDASPSSPGRQAPVSTSRGAASIPTPAVDDAWRKACVVEDISIVSASSIQKKVTRAVDAVVGRTEPKQVVVQLRAKGPATSKMISVVEIAKRQIGLKGEKWYQYNKVEQVLVERKEEGKDSRDDNKKMKEEGNGDGTVELDNKEVEDEEEEEAFETMKTPFERANEGTAKVRAVPVMTIYLTHARIDELKKAYG